MDSQDQKIWTLSLNRVHGLGARHTRTCVCTFSVVWGNTTTAQPIYMFWWPPRLAMMLSNTLPTNTLHLKPNYVVDAVYDGTLGDFEFVIHSAGSLNLFSHDWLKLRAKFSWQSSRIFISSMTKFDHITFFAQIYQITRYDDSQSKWDDLFRTKKIKSAQGIDKQSFLPKYVKNYDVTFPIKNIEVFHFVHNMT